MNAEKQGKRDREKYKIVDFNDLQIPIRISEGKIVMSSCVALEFDSLFSCFPRSIIM